jgi:hypothetical protein
VPISFGVYLFTVFVSTSCVIPCVPKVAVHLGYGTVRVQACIDARGHHFQHICRTHCMWVCVCEGFVMCGCFVFFVLCFVVLNRLCIFIFNCFFCISVRTLPLSDSSIAVSN